MKITSTQNPFIKYVRSLQVNNQLRRAEFAYVIEGVRLAEEALKAKWPAQGVLYETSLSPRGQAVVDGYTRLGVRSEQVSEQVMRSVSDTQNPQGILVVLNIQPASLPEQPNFILIPDQVRDPGNLGSMLRTAAAAGVQAVLIPEASVDIYAPKVVRSAMGAHFHLPIQATTWADISTYLQGSAIQVFLADVAGELPYDQADLRQPLAMIIGGEARGAGQQAAHTATTRLTIPMPGEAESLNAAAATAILLFEVTRQRRNVPDGSGGAPSGRRADMTPVS